MGDIVAIVVLTIVLFAGIFYISRRVLLSIQDPDECIQPAFSRNHGPKSLQKLFACQPYIKHILFSAFVVIALLVISFFVGAVPTEYQNITMLPVAIVTGSVLVLDIVINQGDHNIVCPNCMHKNPVATQWICPYKNCGTQNQPILNDPMKFTKGDNPPLGSPCAGCKAPPHGFFCVTCRKPMYFTNEKELQKPEFCARPVMQEGQVPEPIQEVATEAQQKGEAVSFVESWFTSESDIAHARTLKNKLLAEKKLVMTPEEYERFKEIIEGAFNHKVTSIRTGRGKRR